MWYMNVPRMSARQFRERFGRLTEPVEVLRGVETIGYWYPAGTEPQEQEAVTVPERARSVERAEREDGLPF